ncbi:cyclopropane-fatty-acyl-phospholipid synthase family protein [Xenorhabdus sp. SGI246]|uniref:SAM-dependent methyltransferase n=1 Tax=Xenorhabdus sp. SGI246 TaxID=3158263 RepID=UPI00349FC371
MSQTTLSSDISNASITKQVAEQYESFPFPPVYRIEQEDPDRSLTASFNLDFNLRKEAQLKPGSKIWVPGCGTRWAVMVALQFSDCEIVASDLSSSSITFQNRLAQNLGISNITFKQENLLETEYTDAFDYISCVGVLHHLPSPQNGFKVIHRALKDTGIAEIMVYDYKNRQYSIKMLEILALLDPKKTLSSPARFELAVSYLRALNGHAKVPKELKRVLKYVNERPGFAQELADFICNPQEHYYDVDSLLEILDQADLQVFRWKQPHYFSPDKMLENEQLCCQVRQLPSAAQAKLGSLMSDPLLEVYVSKKGVKLKADEEDMREVSESLVIKAATTIHKYHVNPDGSIDREETLVKYKVRDGHFLFDAGERRPAVLYYGQALDCVTEEPRQWLKLCDMQQNERLTTEQILRMLELTEQPIKIAELLACMNREFGTQGINIDDVKETLGTLCRTPFRLFTVQSK